MSQYVNENAVWRYNDIELELDISDAETIELYEKTFEQMQKEVKSLPTTGRKSEIVSAYCKTLRNVFDRLFGDGTSDKMFGTRNNAVQITAAYESFLEFVSAQNKELDNIQNRIVSRYSPNRAQRRAGK